ncbi:glycosyltransferase family 2 protein [Tessaracoccus flavus]|uniref:Glycosyltransferase 2-like domain-containing protein n=1 Tax=Tessaracoccus flavus TaxID=1610493 RepID=A0A1Q2CI18_9ACTN|nr:glycosyltransferase [Tessaracoccus flavus]AQP45757.1 hypothetical protein RPIT_13860 [Tessaracoccus flavus]
MSVIVPVYNTAKYLEQSVGSVLRQSFPDFELLLIDDGSTDESPVMCDAFALRDSRVKVFHQSNSGVSAARNTGLDHARGEFVAFLDSDDWFGEETLASAVSAAELHRVDVVLWPYVREYAGLSLERDFFNFTPGRFSKEDTRELVCRRIAGLLDEELAHPDSADALVTVWGKLYRRQLITSVDARFTDLSVIGTAEDALFNLQVLSRASSAYYLDSHLYHYRRDNVTSLTQSYKPGLPGQWRELHRRMRDFISDHQLGPSFTQALANRISLSIIGLGLNALRSRKGPVRTVQAVRNLLLDDEYRAAVAELDLRWFPISWRVFFGAAKAGNALVVSTMLAGAQAIIDHRSRTPGSRRLGDLFGRQRRTA